MKNLLRRASILAVFSCALLTPCAHATPGQPGTLDLSWNLTGKVITSIGGAVPFGTNSGARAMAVQADGKVLLAGMCYDVANVDFCAIRYNANGTLDTSWNGTGKTMTPIGGIDDQAYAIAVQSDGKVLLAGYCKSGGSYHFCALRYNGDGTLDASWNGSGKVITPIGAGNDQAFAIAVQPDGKVLLAGTCFGQPTKFCTLRYNANGTLDLSWNGTGKVSTSLGTGDIAYAVAIQPDGKVMVAGTCLGAADNDFCTVRYNVNGTPDSSWNGTGILTTSVGGDDIAAAMSLQPDGKVLIAGSCRSGAAIPTDFCAVRYNSDGTPDFNWNGTGSVVASFSGGLDVRTRAIAVQSDGKVFFAGGYNNDIFALRYNANGVIDTNWNGTGRVVTPVGNFDSAWAVALQRDGKVLLAGACSAVGQSYYDFCAVRYDGGPFGYRNCTPDIDGDGSFLATTDALINMRIALGITGNAVIGGITFSPTATRNTWPLIRDYLVTQCGISLVQ